MAEIRVKDNECWIVLSDGLSVPALDLAFWRKSASVSIMRNLPLSARKSPRLLVSASTSNLDLYCNRNKGRWVYPRLPFPFAQIGERAGNGAFFSPLKLL